MNKTYLKLALDLDFILVAITASLKDYMLCHQINKILMFDFVKVSDHEVLFDARPLSFSKYFYFIEEGEMEYYLVSNRHSEGFLIPEMKKVDFFMVIKPFLSKDGQKELLLKLNKITGVQMAIILEARKLKSKENLIQFRPKKGEYDFKP